MADTRDEYQGLFDVYWPIGLAVFVIIALLVLFVLVRFRSDSNEFPEGRDENRRLEALYAVALACVAAVLLSFTLTTNGDIAADNSHRGSLQVNVTAAKWDWRFDYPRYGIAQQGSRVRIATLVVPEDSEVRFRLSSIDVQHAFWIPGLRFKRDAFPGRSSSFVLTFRDAGFHREQGECAEFCGLRHANMDFNVNVLPQEAFRRWLHDRRAEERRV